MNCLSICYVVGLLAVTISAQSDEEPVGENAPKPAIIEELEPEAVPNSDPAERAHFSPPEMNEQLSALADWIIGVNKSNITAPQNPKVNMPACEPYTPENGTLKGIEIINLTAAMNLITAHRHSLPMVPVTPLPDLENRTSAKVEDLDENATNSSSSAPAPSSAVPQRGRCIAIYLYARWCSFSAAAAPYISALAKQFSSCCMKFVAVDAAHDTSGTTAFFGAGSVPQLIIYRPHRPVVRISPITNDLALLVELVNNATGFNVTIANISALPDEEDYNNNVLPVAPIREFDKYLTAAWLHTILTLLVIAYKFEYVRNLVLSIWNYLRGFGHEMHAHLD